jgi:hypothetical protein
MTLPAILFGILVSTFYGALFHLIFGGNLGRLILYILFSWAGFWAGHFLGYSQEWVFLKLGTLQLGTATIGSLIVMAGGYWLSLVDRGKSV